MKKSFLYLIFVITLLIISPKNVNAVAINDTFATASAICNAGSSINAAVNTNCRATPTAYKTKIYEMGLCSSYPYGTAKTDEVFDSSTCTRTYFDASPSLIDIATSIGGTLTLAGTSTPPASGSYTYPYIVLDQDFTVSGSIVGGSTTYYSTGENPPVSTSSGDFGTQTDSLENFNDENNKCESGIIGATVIGGTMDGFIANSSLTRSTGADNAGASGYKCNKKGRVVAVLNLTTPVVVTSKTTGLSFTFKLTDYGINWWDDNDGDPADNDADVPEDFSSAPFAGYFTVTSN
jgi:hypothetical protein